jgi:site-specific DNA-methyltransferase (adenine-specific)
MSLPEPYYVSEDGRITIYHGDCREILPLLDPVDLVLTDPPYGVGFRGEEWDAAIPDWLPTARAVASVVVFTTAPVTLWDYPRPDWVLCWARPASSSRSLLRGGFNHWSPVVVYGTPKFPTDLLSLHAIAHASPAWIDHPSPKPIALMRWLAEHASNPGDLILDPFMGSGTTLRAAADLGRRAIGIEINEDYCRIAVERLRQGVLL